MKKFLTPVEYKTIRQHMISLKNNLKTTKTTTPQFEALIHPTFDKAESALTQPPFRTVRAITGEGFRIVCKNFN
jgi:hypothetical protein